VSDFWVLGCVRPQEGCENGIVTFRVGTVIWVATTVQYFHISVTAVQAMCMGKSGEQNFMIIFVYHATPT
jgi:hypothetical protein